MARFWASFIVLVGVALSVTNIVYIRFFGRPFDSFVFHGLGYGAGKTLDSVTSLGDFPVAVGALLILSILVIWASLIGFGLIERYTKTCWSRSEDFGCCLWRP